MSTENHHHITVSTDFKSLKVAWSGQSHLKLHSTTSHLHSLHWLKIKERINYKIISLTYSALQSGKPHYLRDIITLQSTRSRSGSLITLSRPPASKLKISNRSFYYMALRTLLWNSLPADLRQPASPCLPTTLSKTTRWLSLTTVFWLN